MNLDIAALKQQWMLPQLLNSGLESVLNYLIGRTAYCAPYYVNCQAKVYKLT